MIQPLYIIDSRGQREPFSFKKVYQSARRVGASQNLAKKIAEIIEKETVSGTKTSDIFKRVKHLLHNEFPKAALRFSLKEGMRKLGPTGFLFEKYIGEIFSKAGFKVKLNQHVSGFCSRYEIDFLAEKKDSLIIGECKYRNLSGQRVALSVALSNHARFLDIKKAYLTKRLNSSQKLKSLLVTNTKFTSKTIKYSQCVGVELLGWRYPKKEGLEDLIDNHRLYPVTILPSFNKDLAGVFVSKKMMLAEDILKLDIERFAKENNVQIKKLASLAKEAELLLEKNS